MSKAVAAISRTSLSLTHSLSTSRSVLRAHTNKDMKEGRGGPRRQSRGSVCRRRGFEGQVRVHQSRPTVPSAPLAPPPSGIPDTVPAPVCVRVRVRVFARARARASPIAECSHCCNCCQCPKRWLSLSHHHPPRADHTALFLPLHPPPNELSLRECFFVDQPVGKPSHTVSIMPFNQLV